MTDCEPRFATVRSPERGTLGRAAVKIARLLGQPLMPWQRRVLDTALETDEHGRLVYSDVVLTVPRQQGKSFLVLVLMVTRALLEARQNIVYTAQSGLDARKKWADDWLPMVKASPLASQIGAYHAPGRESLRFPNGSVQQIVAGTAKAGHGLTVDLGVLDEAFAYQDARTEQALRPAMMTRSDAQLWVVSTAGTPGGSPYLLERVQRGRQAVEADLTSGLAYFEWSAGDDADASDPETWRRCMPALGHTVTESTVEAAFQSMARHEFERAYLNRWVTSMGDPAIPLDEWEQLADLDAPRPAELILAADVAPGSKSAAIAAAGVSDGLLYVSVLEHGPGTDWLVPKLEELTADLGAAEVIVDSKSAAPLLTGIRGVPVTETSATEMGAGCLFLSDLVKNRRLRHRGERELTIALDGAARRPLGDSWAWSRKNSHVDISPLVAVTLSAWAWHGAWSQ